VLCDLKCGDFVLSHTFSLQVKLIRCILKQKQQNSLQDALQVKCVA